LNLSRRRWISEAYCDNEVSVCALPRAKGQPQALLTGGERGHHSEDDLGLGTY
jgi:hypothetical protein